MQPIPLLFNSGLDRSKSPNNSSPTSLYQLLGFMQDPNSFGDIKQTPHYYQSQQKSQGTYYNGGSLTEPSSSAVTALLNDIVTAGGTTTITDYSIWTASNAQVKIFYQTAVPAANTINTQCFIVINSVAGLAINLGGALDVVIDAATTFKWRKNGGGYTPGLACTTTGTSIDGGNATVYFMTTAGFTVNDTWTWTRTDATCEATSASFGSPLQYNYYKSFTFFIGPTSRVMQITTDASSVQYAISVGYRPVYGLGIETFYDHLAVVAYATTSALAQKSKVVGWSDNLDINVFFATDTNEADTYTIPESASLVLKGIVAIRDTLFILSSSRVYYTNYLGLPTVFSFAPYIDLPLGTQISNLFTGDICVAKGSKEGVYITGNGLIYLFNGSTFEVVSFQADPSMVVYSIHFVPTTRELWVRDGNGYIFVYQEYYRTWYTRYAQYDNTSGAPVAVTCISATAKLGISIRKILTQDDFFSVLLPDGGNGASFGTPTIVTQILTGGSYSQEKEIDGTFLAVSGSTSSFYSATQLQLSWYICDAGTITGAATTDAAAVWTTSSTSGLISYPRVAFRGIALKITLTNTATPSKPPGPRFVIREVDLMTTRWPKPAAVR